MLAVVLVAVAGCSAPAIDGTTSEPTESLTPAPVPEDVWADEFAPGLTDAGVVDAVALKDAHVARLADGDFTVERTRVERGENGTLRSRGELGGVFPGDGRYLVVRNFSGGVHETAGTAGTTLQYGDAERTVRLRRAPDGTVRSRSVGRPPTGAVPRSALLAAPFSGRTLLLVFRGVDIDAVTAVNGRDAYRVRGSGVGDRAALRSLFGPTLVERVRVVTVEAVVTADGLVEWFRFQYVVLVGGEPVSVVQTIRFTNLGNTTLAEPAWAEENERTQASGVRSTTVPS